MQKKLTQHVKQLYSKKIKSKKMNELPKYKDGMESLSAIIIHILLPLFMVQYSVIIFHFPHTFFSGRQVLKIKWCMSYYIIVLPQPADTLPSSTFLWEVTQVTLAMKSSSIEAHSTVQPKSH